jgi:hypothetical protein
MVDPTPYCRVPRVTTEGSFSEKAWDVDFGNAFHGCLDGPELGKPVRSTPLKMDLAFASGSIMIDDEFARLEWKDVLCLSSV